MTRLRSLDQRDPDLSKPGLAMIPEADRPEFLARCAETKEQYTHIRATEEVSR